MGIKSTKTMTDGSRTSKTLEKKQVQGLEPQVFAISNKRASVLLLSQMRQVLHRY